MQHRRSAHPGADIRRAGGEVTELLVVGDVELALEDAIDFVDELEGAL